MAQKSYAALKNEIASLEAQAGILKAKERLVIIAEMREDIAAYGIAPKEIFGKGAASGRGASKNAAPKQRAMGAKFSDGNGNVWVGRGPRPKWLRDALKAGKNLSDFEGVRTSASSAAVAGPAASTSAAASAEPVSKKAASKAGKAAKAGKSSIVAKWKDQAGNSWSGRGPQPKWLKAALASGKKPEELRA